MQDGLSISKASENCMIISWKVRKWIISVPLNCHKILLRTFSPQCECHWDVEIIQPLHSSRLPLNRCYVTVWTERKSYDSPLLLPREVGTQTLFRLLSLSEEIHNNLPMLTNGSTVQYSILQTIDSMWCTKLTNILFFNCQSSSFSFQANFNISTF